MSDTSTEPQSGQFSASRPRLTTQKVDTSKKRRKGIGLSEEQKWKISAVSTNLTTRKQQSQNGFWYYLFSFKGRATRADLWLLQLIFLPMAFFAVTFGWGHWRAVVIGFCWFGALMSVGLAVRRLHDLNMSGYVCLIKIMLNVVLLTGVIYAHKEKTKALEALLLTSFDDWRSYRVYESSARVYETAARTYEFAEEFFCWVYGGIEFVWSIVLWFIRGTTGKNKYGEDPLDERSASELAVVKMKNMESAIRNETRKQVLDELRRSGVDVPSPESSNAMEHKAKDEPQSVEERLKRLLALKEDNLITQEDYDARRRQILGEI